MAVTRLSEAQKQEVVARYREGQSSTELAAAYDCSANTVTRLVKAALDPLEYEQLKRQRSRGLRPGPAAEEPAAAAPAPAAVSDSPDTVASVPLAPDTVTPDAVVADATDDLEEEEDDDEDDDEDGPGVLAIDDADDFGVDGEDDGDAVLDDEGDDGEEGDDTFVTVPVHLGAAVEELVQCRAFSEARLPASAYLLVDRTVELQPLALSECPELGPLPEQEAERRALMLFVNPRQAKRHCGRSQRVIKLPDVSLLERTAPYLLAQGISRVVIEGGVYSLPGS
ncbi:helix-turn-helix domain-containing protein [Cyanobium sp. CH-040]|uniref:helix-turn-helix domain-containing protein n=1 Tax=Cyanobium sp. CH-040 TaxID=2823708 RepID=UPI0020CEEC5C|nr:helix-turn-helix domain-containing protein [Cyanobium sp. CH-040]MCP9926319.1 sigma-70 family RNA polymerase sigma factor [Cyanobium sp. CH-040]